MYGVGRISQVGASTEYFLGDALGSVRQLTDASGAITHAKSYAPYGEVMSSAGNGASVFAFTGEQTDSNGLTYLRARYYSGEVGRFLSRDTWGGDYNNPLSLNRWIYVEGNPVNQTDPTGYQGELPPWAEKILKDLRAETQSCFESGDIECVYWNYIELAAGGRFLGYQHASEHLTRYLFKIGDLHYPSGLEMPVPQRQASKWVFGDWHIRKTLRQETKEMMAEIHNKVLTGVRKDHITTSRRTTEVSPDGSDFYYALNNFTVYIEADYEVSGCTVVVKPIYQFIDEYDWHPGIPAGGAVVGLAGFKDEWAASLKPKYAEPYQITGEWKGPNKVYKFDAGWFLNWPASKNSYISWDYLDARSKLMDIFHFDE